MRIRRYLENGTSESVKRHVIGIVSKNCLKSSSSKNCANARGTRYRSISGLRRNDVARERDHLESRGKRSRLPLNLLYIVATSIFGAIARGRRQRPISGQFSNDENSRTRSITTTGTTPTDSYRHSSHADQVPGPRPRVLQAPVSQADPADSGLGMHLWCTLQVCVGTI